LTPLDAAAHFGADEDGTIQVILEYNPKYALHSLLIFPKLMESLIEKGVDINEKDFICLQFSFFFFIINIQF